MKNNSYIKALLMLPLIGVLGACNNSGFLDVNNDPSRPKTVPPPLAFTAGQAETAYSLGSDLYVIPSEFVQQNSGGGNSANATRIYDQYQVSNADINNAFFNVYASTLNNVQYVINQSDAAGSPAYSGVARILKAFNYGILVDCWGNVPYREALKGALLTQPKYDDSKTVYDSLFVLIDQGIADLKKTSALVPGSDDLIYGGDLTKWEKFGNTLKLRLALNYAKVDAGALLRQFIGSGVPFMASNADNFSLAFENVADRQNPIDRYELQRQDYIFPSAFLVNLMNSKSDPRRTTYFTDYPYKSGNYVGITIGTDQTQNVSRIHTFLRGPVINASGATAGGALGPTDIQYAGDAPIRMLTFAEYNFIRAEAALVYGASGDVLTFFRAGIEASLQEAGISGAAADAYVAAQGATTPTLEQIINEKYIANYGVGVQPWTDYRRTGFPAITPSPIASTPTVPRIFLYPLSESQANPTNVPNRTNIFEKGVFWDK